MFRGLFGAKSSRPAPPKNQIEVVCPACGAAQYEPRLVVSTFCKSCGVHLSIQRKKVTASPTSRSGMGMPNPWATTDSSVTAKQLAAPTADTQPSTPPLAPELAKPVSQEEMAVGGFGAFLKQQAQAAAASATPTPSVDEAKAEPPAPPPPKLKPLAQVAFTPPPEPPAPKLPDPPPAAEPAPEKPQDVAPPVQEASSEPPPEAPEAPATPEVPATLETPAAAEVSPAPPPTPRVATPPVMSESTLQKMRNQGLYRNQYFKEVECFDCHHKFKTSRSSRSASCPGCNAFIMLEDVEINMDHTQPIKTRGDVLIRKRGRLHTTSVECRDLRCFGELDAQVKVEGDAIFRNTGAIQGKIRSHRLIIEKGADVTFAEPVEANEIEVYARVTGTLIAHGPLLIGTGGSVNGDVTVRSVSIETGGELNGGMSIIRAPQISSEPPKPKTEESEPQS